ELVNRNVPAKPLFAEILAYLFDDESWPGRATHAMAALTATVGVGIVRIYACDKGFHEVGATRIYSCRITVAIYENSEMDVHFLLSSTVWANFILIRWGYRFATKETFRRTQVLPTKVQKPRNDVTRRRKKVQLV